MSESTTTTNETTDATVEGEETTPDATTTAVPEWTYDPTVAADDNSRVSDPKAMLALIPEWERDANRAVIEAKRYRGATKMLAERRVQARSLVILANGFPDWAADSDQYKQAVRAGESGAMARLSKQAARDLSNATKQQVRRVFLTPGVVGWILQHENGFGDEAARFFGTPAIEADPENGVEAVEAVEGDPDAVLSAPSDALKHRVRAHYAAADLKLEHPSFREKVADTNPGPGTGNPDNPLETFRGGMGTLGQITPGYSVPALLEAVSDVCGKLIDNRDKEVEGRPEIIGHLQRIALIAAETAAALDVTHDGTFNADALKTAMYDSKTDAPATA